MTSTKICEEKAGIVEQGGASQYVLLPSYMRKVIDLQPEELTDLIIGVYESDKHGKHFVIFSPSNQTRLRKQKIAEAKQQAKL
jgi:hypothetical protein